MPPAVVVPAWLEPAEDTGTGTISMVDTTTDVLCAPDENPSPELPKETGWSTTAVLLLCVMVACSVVSAACVVLAAVVVVCDGVVAVVACATADDAPARASGETPPSNEQVNSMGARKRPTSDGSQLSLHVCSAQVMVAER